MNKDKFAVFIDAENLTSWIKDDGPAKLLKELGSAGQVIVRRAYGKWTNSNLNQLQEILNRNGFELLHNFHPVSEKNSSYVESLGFLKLENDIVKYNKLPKIKHVHEEPANTPIDTKAYYKKILKRKNWDHIPKALLDQLYKKAVTFNPTSKQSLVKNLLTCNFEGTTSNLIRNTLGIFYKSKLVQVIPNDSDDDKKWKIIKTDEYLRNIDTAMLSRLISGIKENEGEVRSDILRILCYGKYSTNEFEIVVTQAEEYIVNKEE